ncbi:hypothetical protein [Chromobacterium sp. ATCC 53434]|uniref:hypothetical protein n=1 Tax=Chromobacterium sp. (strain ATCC 53434 / SC 14030) TaxID=2059672 RepID=UPI00130515D0|nr:hypothetical protein [Chromobacterium sp. ATCC 53434]
MTADDGRFEADRTSPIQKHGPGNRAIFIPETMIPLRQATPAHAKPGSLSKYPPPASPCSSAAPATAAPCRQFSLKTSRQKHQALTIPLDSDNSKAKYSQRIPQRLSQYQAH